MRGLQSLVGVAVERNRHLPNEDIAALRGLCRDVLTTNHDQACLLSSSLARRSSLSSRLEMLLAIDCLELD